MRATSTRGAPLSPEDRTELTYWRALQVGAAPGWYAEAGGRIDTIRADFAPHATLEAALAAAVALAPRARWEHVLGRFLPAALSGARRPPGIYRRSWDRARGALQPGADFGTLFPARTSPKSRAFLAALKGDRGAVAVDVWGMRVVTGRRKPRSLADYYAVAEVYRTVARRVGVDPRDVQSMTWEGVRDYGVPVLPGEIR